LTNKGMGYNPKFMYPRDGGIECLPKALARPLRSVHLGETLEFIDAKYKYVRLKSGREESYDFLISTLPVSVLYQMIQDAPDALRHEASRLQAVSVLNINIGVARPNISDQHWIYFPEDQFIFSRVGFPANFSKSVAPEGASSMYIEITHHPHELLNLEETFERCLTDLQAAGILHKDDRILTRHFIDIKFAYVVFNEHRQKHLRTLIDYLESRGIYTAGRYGRWDYFSMEDSILSGKAAAERIFAASGNGHRTDPQNCRGGL